MLDFRKSDVQGHQLNAQQGDIVAFIIDICNSFEAYPAQVGEPMILHGENFYEVIEIVFEGSDGTDVKVAGFTINEELTQISFDLPAGVEPTGNCVLYTEAGPASVPFALELPPAEIISISSDMPVRGAEFFITGSYFIGVQNVNINGEIDIPAADLRVSFFLYLWRYNDNSLNQMTFALSIR